MDLLRRLREKRPQGARPRRRGIVAGAADLDDRRAGRRRQGRGEAAAPVNLVFFLLFLLPLSLPSLVSLVSAEKGEERVFSLTLCEKETARAKVKKESKTKVDF